MSAGCGSASRRRRCRTKVIRVGIAPHAAWRCGIGCSLILAACMPGTPRIDGAPGAPPRPSTLWPVPPAALARDSATAATGRELSLTDVMDLALRNNPQTRQSWALALASANEYGASRGALFPTVNAGVNLTQSNSSLGTTANGTSFTNTQLDSTGSSRALFGGTSRSAVTPSVTLSYLVLDLGGRAGTI